MVGIRRWQIPNFYHYCQNPTMVGFWLVGICRLALFIINRSSPAYRWPLGRGWTPQEAKKEEPIHIDKDHKRKQVILSLSVFKGGASSLRYLKESSKESGSYVTARLITILWWSWLRPRQRKRRSTDTGNVKGIRKSITVRSSSALPTTRTILLNLQRHEKSWWLLKVLL